MATIDLTPRTLTERAGVASEAAAAHADEVDRDARFPIEAIDALRAEGLLGALIPVELGGGGTTVGQVAEVVEQLGRSCATTAMVFAMHQIQVACLVRHGGTPTIEGYLREVAANGLLLASATTELGVGGDTRSSICAVEPAEGGFRLEKQAPVISYGEHADGILATARRTPDSPPNDQVLVVCRRPHVELERLSEWDALGFRGTCSNGFRLTVADDESWVLPEPYGDISSQTMLPTSHVVWGSVWLGLAAGATDRAKRFVQGEARKKPGTTPPAALHLADLVGVQQQFADLVHGAARRFDELADDRDALDGMAFAIAMNSLKVSASQLVVDVVHRALQILGMAGYRNDSPLSLGRHLRDAHGAALMVNNDRLTANNAQMLLIHRER
ncbi:MAG: putative acyl-CoA dehydrogenase [Actinomycetia bacterium]|nr:putative acyl-CoA dehydrogenase [Actinomycetes bacterium]